MAARNWRMSEFTALIEINGQTYFGHHASPCNYICFHPFPLLLLKSHNRLEQTVKMIIRGVIELLKGIETLG